MYIRHKLNNIKCSIKWAFQRVYRGYDDRAVWNYDMWFTDMTIKILTRFNSRRYGLWNIPKDSEYYERLKLTHGTSFSNEETGAIIDVMIRHLQMTDADYAEKEIFGKNIYDKDYVVGCRTVEDYKKIDRVMQDNKERFMKLFNEFFWDLWD